TIHVQVEIELCRELVDEAVGLGEEIPGIDQHDRDVRLRARDEVQRDGGLSAETRAQDVPCRQVLQRPLAPLRGIQRLALAVAALERGLPARLLVQREALRAVAGRECTFERGVRRHQAASSWKTVRRAKSPNDSPGARPAANSANNRSSTARMRASSTFSSASRFMRCPSASPPRNRLYRPTALPTSAISARYGREQPFGQPLTRSEIGSSRRPCRSSSASSLSVRVGR